MTFANGAGHQNEKFIICFACACVVETSCAFFRTNVVLCLKRIICYVTETCHCAMHCNHHLASPSFNFDQSFVCGSDGRTYITECHMRLAACRCQSPIKPVWRGSCEGGEEMFMNRRLVSVLCCLFFSGTFPECIMDDNNTPNLNGAVYSLMRWTWNNLTVNAMCHIHSQWYNRAQGRAEGGGERGDGPRYPRQGQPKSESTKI